MFLLLHLQVHLHISRVYECKRHFSFFTEKIVLTCYYRHLPTSICNSKAYVHISEPVERDRVPRVADSSHIFVGIGRGRYLYREVLCKRVFFYYLIYFSIL